MPLIENTLLIDDDDVNNYINARLLKKLSFTEKIHVALNGEEALKFVKDLLQTNQPLPNLIFLDINMPVMDGFEFLKHFTRFNFPDGPPVLIMLTTSSNEQDINQIANQPIVAGYLNKPLTEKKVKDILAKHFPQNAA